MVDTASAQQRIVVGIDGSSASVAALEWAAKQAALTGATIEATTTWQWPQSYGYPMPIMPDYNPADDAQKVVQETVEKVRPQHPDLHIEMRIVEGPPAQVLVERSKTAALLVLGNRGHGEFAGMLLGSVSEHCVAHAHCPIVVIRH